jgi:dTDP-4-dehydrorhamnose 3,5-epimerase
MFEIIETGLDGCLELIAPRHDDSRGHFVKTIHADFFKQHHMNTAFVEQYYTVSVRGTLRGLHFQTPPHDHDKLVICSDGEVFDVVVDLRRTSPTFGEHRIFNLSAARANQIYIPAGLAHGFYTSSAQATLVYNVTSVHNGEHDAGIHYASAGINWPTEDVTISERDAKLPPLADYDSPFP